MSFKFKYLFTALSTGLFLIIATNIFSKIEAYYHSYNVQHSYKNKIVDEFQDLSLVTWTGNSIDITNPLIKEKIQEDYRKAWKQLSKTILTKNTKFIEHTFHKDVIDKFEEILNRENQLKEMIDLEHHLELIHLSADYSVAVIRDYNAKVLSSIQYENKSVLKEIERYDLDVHLVLSDGEWKIMNWSQTKLKEKKNTSRNQPQLDSYLEKLKNSQGVNYYPSAHPWLSFWENFDSNTISKDLNKVKELGLNTIRIFIPFESFGRRDINEIYIDHLDTLLAEAKHQQINVLPTLFDFPIGFEPEQYVAYYKQLKFILERYKNNETIIAWSLKNEPDIDYQYHDPQKVQDWLTFIIQQAKEIDPNHPVSIGWAYPENAKSLMDELDYISLHHYGKLNALEESIDYFQSVNKLVLIEEFGHSSSSSIWNLFLSNENKQMKSIEETLDLCKEKQIPWSLWTLYDFPDIPSYVFGNKPWIKEKQAHFGILKANGSMKPVANLIKSY